MDLMSANKMIEMKQCKTTLSQCISQKKWKINNPEYDKKWMRRRREDPIYVKKELERARKRYHNNPKTRETSKKCARRWQLNNPEKVRLNKRIWNKNNPHSSRRYSLELQLAMNNVRIRDNNTCKWHHCGLTKKETEIHVHHIFPRKDYPRLELVEKYMICYCKKHHRLFHSYRGDINLTLESDTLITVKTHI